MSMYIGKDSNNQPIEVAPVINPASGKVTITQNGNDIDVSLFESADVNVVDNTILNALIDGTLTEIKNDDVTTIQAYKFNNMRALQKAVFPNVTSIEAQTFFNCTSITDIELPSLTTITGNSAFASCTALKKIFLKNLTNLVQQQTFNNCTRLETVDMGKSDRFNNAVFGNCTSLTALIMRSTHVVSLYGVQSFTGSSFRNGTGGTAYVPYNLVSSYQSHSIWSVLESVTFSTIQENLVTLQSLGVDITDYYEIITEFPTTDIDDTIVYFIETATSGTYEQWFHGSGAWEQLSNITLQGGDN